MYSAPGEQKGDVGAGQTHTIVAQKHCKDGVRIHHALVCAFGKDSVHKAARQRIVSAYMLEALKSDIQ
jgi:hypothetical protein